MKYIILFLSLWITNLNVAVEEDALLQSLAILKGLVTNDPEKRLICTSYFYYIKNRSIPKNFILYQPLESDNFETCDTTRALGLIEKLNDQITLNELEQIKLEKNIERLKLEEKIEPIKVEERVKLEKELWLIKSGEFNRLLSSIPKEKVSAFKTIAKKLEQQGNDHNRINFLLQRYAEDYEDAYYQLP